MLEVLTVTVLKAIASTCVKLYITSLFGAGNIVYDSKELGYRVPRWYMNPGRRRVAFHAFGTSIKGDEFESLADAKEKAVQQMVKHIRLGNQMLIAQKVQYDAASVKQQRFVEIFVRGPGLADFVRANATVTKKQFVEVTKPETDIRAFVRLSLPAKRYIAHQTKKLHELKTRLVRQKSEDILEEIEAEKAAGLGQLMPEPGPSSATEPRAPDRAPGLGQPAGPAGVDDAFRELEQETGR